MQNELFQRLIESIREAGRIHRGEIAPARITHLESANARAEIERAAGDAETDSGQKTPSSPGGFPPGDDGETD